MICCTNQLNPDCFRVCASNVIGFHDLNNLIYWLIFLEISLMFVMYDCLLAITKGIAVQK